MRNAVSYLWIGRFGHLLLNFQLPTALFTLPFIFAMVTVLLLEDFYHHPQPRAVRAPLDPKYPISELVPGQKSQTLPEYSATDIFTEILGPLDQLTLISLGKLGTNIVNDGAGRTILRFATVPNPVQYYGRMMMPNNTVILDPQQQILLEAKPHLGTADVESMDFESFNLVLRDLGEEKIVGTCDRKTSLCSTSLQYEMMAPRSGKLPGNGPIVLEANGSTKNCCCFSADSIQFSGYDPKVQGAYRPMVTLKRLPVDPLVAPGGQSQLVFDKDVPIVYKIWMLYMAWRIHDRNFTQSFCNKHGRRGKHCNFCWCITSSVLSCLFFTVLVIALLL